MAGNRIPQYVLCVMPVSTSFGFHYISPPVGMVSRYMSSLFIGNFNDIIDSTLILHYSPAAINRTNMIRMWTFCQAIMIQSTTTFISEFKVYSDCENGRRIKRQKRLEKVRGQWRFCEIPKQTCSTCSVLLFQINFLIGVIKGKREVDRQYEMLSEKIQQNPY